MKNLRLANPSPVLYHTDRANIIAITAVARADCNSGDNIDIMSILYFTHYININDFKLISIPNLKHIFVL